MKFGAGVIINRTTWDDIRTSIETVEAGRWNSLWFPDHFFPPRGGRETEHLPVFESFYPDRGGRRHDAKTQAR